MRIQSCANYFKSGLIGLAMSVPANSGMAFVHDAPIVKNNEMAILLKNKALFDNSSYRRLNLISNELSRDINTAKFYKSLNKNKKALLDDLQLSENQYDMYKRVIKRIGQTEQSYNTVTFSSNSFYDKFFKTPQDSAQLIMYKFNIRRLSNDELKLMKKYNIQYPNPNSTPEDIAVRTVIHLAELEKYYPKYLAIMKEFAPDTAKTDVQNSIKNAKAIMKNRFIAEIAINDLEIKNSILSGSAGRRTKRTSGVFTDKDLEDLKIYAKTIVFNKEDFLTEMWCHRNIIPVGKNSDKACANILYLKLNKY